MKGVQRSVGCPSHSSVTVWLACVKGVPLTIPVKAPLPILQCPLPHPHPSLKGGGGQFSIKWPG